jgi:KaiC/GvpD/RAD55 family RecA-like ATPase
MRTHAFFYFRAPTFINALLPEKQPDFRAEDREHAEKLRKLKDHIRSSGLPVRENYRYDDLDAFGRQVLEDLWSAIEAEHPEEAPEPDPLDTDRAYHDFFIETRTELFIGQRHLLARLHKFASGATAGPLVVTGTPGCGKSALLAKFVSQFRRLEPDTFILYHFVGASPSSTDPRQMLLRLCRELARRFGFEDEIPEDWSELPVRFWRFCQRAAEQSRLVVVIDVLNQLDETYRAHELGWLPPVVSPRLRLIVSSLEGDTLDAARRKYRHRQDLIVTSLRLVDQGFIIARQSQQARKRLTTARKHRLWRKQQMAQGQPVPPDENRSQLGYILTGVYCRRHEPTPEQTIQRETTNALYLHLAAEELRLFGSFDRLADFIARLPTDVPGMFQTVLERLEQDHGRELVEHSLSLVATGRHGLLESELLDLLARLGEQHFPMALWSRLYRSLAFYLKPRASVGGGEEGLIDFFHRQLAKVVHQRYVEAPETQQARHVELAAYFQRKGDPAGDGSWTGNYPRSLAELTHHQIEGQPWDSLEQTLTTLFYLEANVTASRVFDLAGQFSAAIAVLPEDHAQRRILRLLEEALRRDIHFIARHAQDYPQGLFQCLWNSCWWYDCPDAAQHYLPSTAREPGGDGSSLPSPVRGRGAGGEGSLNQGAATLRPRERPSPRLHDLLEHWRRQKEKAQANFPWLRSHRPPPLHLGAAQLAVLRARKYRVLSVSYSPDGRRIVGGSDDNKVRVWDAASGRCLEVIQGVGDVCAIAAGLPLRALSCGPDTVIERVASGEPVAWLPESLKPIVTHASGRTWAGAAVNNVYIATLESGDTLPVGNQPQPLLST